MAMSKCKECGKAVSTLAKTCPNCGVPKPTLKKKTLTKKISKKTKRSINPYQDVSWSHCSNTYCKDYTQMYRIPTSALAKRVCIVCGVHLKKAEIENGRPVMPTDGTYMSGTYSIKRPGHIDRVNKTNKVPDYVAEEKPDTDNPTEKDALSKFSDGELDLATSFWGFLIVGTVVVGFVCGWLSAAYGKGWVIPLGLYTIFAVQGTWSAAEKYKIEQNKKKQTLVWGFLAQAVCVLNGISIIGIIAEFF